MASYVSDQSIDFQDIYYLRWRLRLAWSRAKEHNGASSRSTTTGDTGCASAISVTVVHA